MGSHRTSLQVMSQFSDSQLIDIDERKVQQRDATYTVSIPKAVVDGLDIDKGQELAAAYDQERDMIVYRVAEGRGEHD